jgi:hypothetical protein
MVELVLLAVHSESPLAPLQSLNFSLTLDYIGGNRGIDSRPQTVFTRPY